MENNEKEKGSKQCNPVSNAASDNLSIFKIFLVRYCSFVSEHQYSQTWGLQSCFNRQNSNDCKRNRIETKGNRNRCKKVTVNKTIYMESIKTPKTKHTKIIKANIAQGDKPKGLDEKNPHHFCKSAGSLMR